MKNTLIVATFLFIVGGCEALKLNKGSKAVDFEIITLDGAVQYHYTNDYGIFHITGASYSDSNVSCIFREDFRFISEHCNADTISKIFDLHKYHGKDISDYAQYWSQHVKNPEAGIYYGGDIYYSNGKRNIAIAFHLVGKGILFYSVCKEYLKYDNLGYEDCVILPDPLQTPFIALLEIDTIYSLSMAEQKLLQLSDSQLKHFVLGICE